MITYQQGLYVCEVVEVADTTSQAGNDVSAFKVRPTHRVVDDELLGVDDSWERTIWLTWTEKAAPISYDKLRQAGLIGDDYHALVGQSIRCRCTHEPDRRDPNGDLQERWDFESQREIEHDPAVHDRIRQRLGRLAAKDEPPRTPQDNPYNQADRTPANVSADQSPPF